MYFDFDDSKEKVASDVSQVIRIDSLVAVKIKEELIGHEAVADLINLYSTASVAELQCVRYVHTRSHLPKKQVPSFQKKGLGWYSGLPGTVVYLVQWFTWYSGLPGRPV